MLKNGSPTFKGASLTWLAQELPGVSCGLVNTLYRAQCGCLGDVKGWPKQELLEEDDSADQEASVQNSFTCAHDCHKQ